MSTLYKVDYLHYGSPVDSKYIIATSRVKAIEQTQPFWNNNEPRNYTDVKIMIICETTKIINYPHETDNRQSS